MRKYKLQVHQNNFSEEDLVINPKDFPHINVGDVVEIYHPADEYSRLLLQVTCMKDDFQSKDTISVECSIATSFHLRKYSEVYVNVVSPKEVELHSVELTFKDQYLARSDMWRLKQSINNTCVYGNKTVTFAGIRAQVYEMWSQGERVASGVVTPDTKVVYRSSTSMVYLFMQMSSEMWDFDINGDLYFEKGVYGFLADLFAKWKKHGCNHDVTVVLFSRTFFKAQSIDEFPEHMRECLQQDYKGRFYEDFYRVAVQNERYDDWNNILVELKRLFNYYIQTVLQYHDKPGIKIPEVYNSTAAQGNFLEVLNISLNVFERHYIDRSLDRTGQLSVVITPGVGVFEVDRELANVTKQRIIDSGIGSDLVCLGEQPLHAVPLFKFQSKQQCYSVVDDYNMPHWINLSFYSCTNKRLHHSDFLPRLKLPTNLLDNCEPTPQASNVYSTKRQSNHDQTFPSLFDYNAYDAEIFKYTGQTQTHLQQIRSSQITPQHKKFSGSLNKIPLAPHMVWRKMSEDKTASGALLLPSSDELPSPGFSSSSLSSRSSAINIPSSINDSNMLSVSYGALRTNGLRKSPTNTIRDESDNEFSRSPLSRSMNRLVVGSAGFVSDGTTLPGQNRSRNSSGNNRPSRALINPFDPSHLTIKLSSNRRRWTHVFPQGPKGGFMQEHHRKVQPEKSDIVENDSFSETPTSPRQEVVQAAQLAVQARKQMVTSTLERNKEKHKSVMIQSESSPINVHPPVNFPSSSEGSLKTKPPTFKSSSYQGSDVADGKNLLLVWGATGEQEWSPGITTGVDWKSLTIPACLPITTDYFPDKRSLQNDYVISDYCLHPDDINADFSPVSPYEVDGEIKQQTMSADELFKELVLQRLQQGFQIIFLPKNHLQHVSQIQISSSPQYTPNLTRSRSRHDFGEEYFLSIGRIFHKLSLVGPMITVTQFRPRHPYPQINVHYRYRFQAPDNLDYGVSWVSFTTQLLENYGWNYLDHYICMKGEGDYTLKDTFNYWRINLAVLPLISATTRKIIDESPDYCDIYPRISEDEQKTSMDGFCKFAEILNKIRRPVNIRKQKCHAASRRVSSNVLLHTAANAVSVASSVPGQQQQNQSQSAFRERVCSNRVHDRPRSMSGAKIRERNKSESGNFQASTATPAIDLLANTSDSLRSLSSNDSQGENQSSSLDLSESYFKLSVKTSTPMELVEAMKNNDHGLSFLMKHPGLPSWSFISYEAVMWLQENVDGVTCGAEAIKLLQEIKAKGFLLHASRTTQHPILNGFYIYYFTTFEIESSRISMEVEQYEPSEQFEDFQKQWFEIEIPNSTKCIESNVPTFLHPNLNLNWENKATIYNRNKWSYRRHTVTDMKDPVYKYTTLELDSGSTKDGRLEWGSALYHSIYNPMQAFEIIVQWMVATGSLLSDLLTTWQRKANVCGLHLIPIPSDPFALPFSGKSDPLRGPVFVPLELDCLLTGGKKHLFEHYIEMEQEQRLVLFQESITQKFGFIPMQNELQQTVGGFQYVHLTGAMFVMITRKSSSILNQVDDFRVRTVEPEFGNRLKVEVQQVSNPHEEYSTRHVTTRSSNPTNPSNKVGFLWSWNHMLSKRWRSQYTGEAHFQDKLLSDFLNFCSNKDGRLEQFWDESMQQHLMMNLDE